MLLPTIQACLSLFLSLSFSKTCHLQDSIIHEPLFMILHPLKMAFKAGLDHLSRPYQMKLTMLATLRILRNCLARLGLGRPGQTGKARQTQVVVRPCVVVREGWCCCCCPCHLSLVLWQLVAQVWLEWQGKNFSKVDLKKGLL